MGDEGKALAATKVVWRVVPWATRPAAAATVPEPVPVPEPPLAPLPPELQHGSATAAQAAIEPAVLACHICRAPASEQRLDGVRGLVRCEDWRGCSDRAGDRRRALTDPGTGAADGLPVPVPAHDPGAGAAHSGPAPAPVPGLNSGAGVRHQSPAAPAPGKPPAVTP